MRHVRLGDVGLLFVASFTLLASLAIYLPASLALRSQPRGEWTCLLLAEASVPIIIVITDAENHAWHLVRWPSLVAAPNLVAVALLLTPAAIRYAWRPPTDPPHETGARPFGPGRRDPFKSRCQHLAALPPS